MGAMDRRKMTGNRARLIAILPLAIVCLAFVVVPLGLTLSGGLGSVPKPGGFAQDTQTLQHLVLESLIDSLGGSLIAACVALMASLQTFQSNVFGGFYRRWLTTALFVNPVFLVLGFSSILASWSPHLAVIVATAFVVLPLGGLIIQAAVDEFPKHVARAAAALGADPRTVITSHILPSVSGQIGVSLLLMASYALGFYLLPTFVGFGNIRTLAVSINVLTNQVGDWQAAQQVACILLAVELLLLCAWLLLVRLFLKGVRR